MILGIIGFGDTYSSSLWYNAQKFFLPHCINILNLSYYLAICILITLSLVLGLYVMLPPVQSLFDPSTPFFGKVGEFIINKDVRAALADGNENDASIICKHVIGKNIVLILVIMGIKYIVRFLFG